MLAEAVCEQKDLLSGSGRVLSGHTAAVGYGVQGREELLFRRAVHCQLLYRAFSNIIISAILQAGSLEIILLSFSS